MIVGIDNGLSGGLVAISEFSGEVIDKIPMPCRPFGSKNEPNIRVVNDWLVSLNTPFTIAIEEPLNHARSSQAMRSMAIGFGKLVGMAESHDYPVQRISVHSWQKRMLGRIPKGKTKEHALMVAQAIAPEENWLANKRCRTPHDGMIDAFLIARYYRAKTKKLDEP